jgi:hypothetical protein
MKHKVAVTIITWTIVVVYGLSTLTGCSESRRETTEIRLPERRSLFDRRDWELEQAMAKVTWMGSQESPIGTIMIRTKDCRIEPEICRRFQLGSEYRYHNDNITIKVAEVTPNEFRRMLTATRPIVEPLIGREADEDLSFVVVRGADGKFEGFEVRLPKAERGPFYRAVLSALKAENTDGRRVVTRQFGRVVE